MAKMDAARLAELVDARTRDLRDSLQKLERDATAIKRSMNQRGRRFKADRAGRASTVAGLRADVNRLRQRFSRARRAQKE